MRRPRLVILVLVAIASLGATACGGDDSANPVPLDAGADAKAASAEAGADAGKDAAKESTR